MILALLLCLPLGQARGGQDAAKIEQAVRYANDPDRPQLHLRAVDRLKGYGAAAVVPEVLKFAKEKGYNALSIAFTEGLGEFKDARITTLLMELIADQDFFWRPTAMRALTRHAEPKTRDTFRKGLDDRLWGCRASAVLGLEKLDDRASKAKILGLLGDEVYDVRARAAKTLYAFGDSTGLPILVEALRANTVWFDIDYGQIAREDAWKFLKTISGDPFGYKPWESASERAPGLAKFEAWIARTMPDWREKVPEKARVKAEKIEYVFGYELRSCQRGDFFFRIDTQGRFVLGYFNLEKVRLSPDELRAFRKALEKVKTIDRSFPYGEGGCDFEQYYLQKDARFEKLWIGLKGRPDAAQPFIKVVTGLVRDKFGPKKAEQFRASSLLFRTVE